MLPLQLARDTLPARGFARLAVVFSAKAFETVACILGSVVEDVQASKAKEQIL